MPTKKEQGGSLNEFNKLVEIVNKKAAVLACKNNEYVDRRQAGLIRLLEGFPNFNQDRGVSFLTYASRCIENAILRVNKEANAAYKYRLMHENIVKLTRPAQYGANEAEDEAQTEGVPETETEDEAEIDAAIEPEYSWTDTSDEQLIMAYDFFDKLTQQLTQRQQSILLKRVGEDLEVKKNLSQLAKEFNVSIETIRRELNSIKLLAYKMTS